VKKIKPSIIFLFTGCLLFFLGLAWFLWASSPVCSSNCQNEIFIVKKGESLGEIAQNLEEEGLVHSSLAFQFIAAKLGITRQIQAGDFRLNPKMSPEEIARELTLGTLDRWITLVEGWRREQMAVVIATELEGEESQFNEEGFLNLTKNLEGKLFPDTYLVPKDADASRVVEMLTTNFEKKTTGLEIDQRALILASIIEREARYDEDRPIVAGILLNRLNGGMPLQADATLQYAKANVKCQTENGECDWWAEISAGDKKLNSTYNTYLYQGLPPAPICNPGLASIEAALNPRETDYWFYLSDSEGQMHYAQTLKEHNVNIEKYLR
jgi:UPF0755 protein